MANCEFVLIKFLHSTKNYGEIVPKCWLYEIEGQIYAAAEMNAYNLKYPIPSEFTQAKLQILQQKIINKTPADSDWQFFQVIVIAFGKITHNLFNY